MVEKVGLEFPTRVSINITKRCNLSCKHCLSSSGKADINELTTEEFRELIDQLRGMGSPILAIGGGEPLIRKDIFEVVGYARGNNLPVSIVTNGTLLTRRIAEKLNSLSLTSVTVSVDGLEENHDFVRGNGNFGKTVEGIKILRKYVSTSRLSIRMVVNARNIKDCSRIIGLAEDLGLDSIRLTPILPMGRAIENAYLLLSQGQYLQFLEDCHVVESKIEIVLPDQRLDLRRSRFEGFGGHCGKESCWITQTGEVYPCIFYGEEYSAGNVREARFVDLWERCKQMSRFSGNEYCNACKVYERCRGGCRCRALWQYGDINAIDPYCPLEVNKNYEETISNHRIPVSESG